jgi:hypothetical protein
MTYKAVVPASVRKSHQNRTFVASDFIFPIRFEHHDFISSSLHQAENRYVAAQ